MKGNGKDKDGKLSRRGFIKCSAFLGGSVLLADRMRWALDFVRRAEAGTLNPGEEYELAKAENILYTVCLQCNTGCGIKVKLLNGVAVKIDGNPVNPWTMIPQLPYKTSPFEAAKFDTITCPKGKSGIQSVYDPYRLVKVLKRAGKRGENKWVTISFDQAISEIVNGGRLFQNVPGEENRVVEGLKELWAVRDPKLAKALADDAAKVAKKEISLEAFKEKYKEHLNLLVNPDHPDLGPKNNQLLFMWGRLKAGRSEFIGRFAGDSFGSVNRHGHTTVCQGSLYFAGKAMSEQYRDGKWTGGRKFYWQADAANAEFVIFAGCSPFEANYPPPRASGIVSGLASGRLKIAVVDPRLSKTAAKAWRWVPNKPGSEGALALGMIRWIIENKRYDARYLSNANRAAAKADGEPTWTNATWLVKKDGSLLRAKEVGLGDDLFVVVKDGKPQAVNSYDEKTSVEGDLFYSGEINGIPVKTGFQLLWDEASSKTIEEWAKISGVSPDDIVVLAREFTAHGKKACADVHRGVSQHTNGFYNVLAWMALNLLIGNFDWKGGMVSGSTFAHMGGRKEQPFDLGKMAPGKTTAFGVSVIRHEVKYEDTTLFKGYPAKRPWYPLASDLYQEILPSAGDGYPYPVKAVFLYMGSPVYSLPGGQTNVEILSDVKKVPLFITWDIVVGETSLYADYIFPDLSYLERWEMQGSHPFMAPRVQPVRNPVIAPIPETVKVFGQEMPISLESTLMALAEKLGLPGFGKDGFGPGLDFNRPEDFYLKMVANVATHGEAVPDADDKEIKLFLESRRHLPKTVFDPDKWLSAVGEKWWHKVVYVLNRGGRFEDYDKAFEGDQVKNKYGTFINMYQEKTAKTKNSMTGKPFLGLATYLPIADSLGRALPDEKFDLHLITYREIFHTKSRTISNYWLLEILPENFVLMNVKDADRLGLKDGDKVKIVSASNPQGVWDLKRAGKKPIVGKVKTTQGIRPGVIGFSVGYGHWAYGARSINVDGQLIRADGRRTTGVHANAAMRLDPYLKNTCLSDVTGGSAVFYDTRVKLVKIKA